MEVIVTSKEELKNLIDDSVSKALKKLYSEKESEYIKKDDPTIKEAAAELKVVLLTIRNYISKGYLESYRVGKRILIKRSSIEKAKKEIKSIKYRR